MSLPAYAIVDFSEITDPDAYRETMAKAPAAVAAAGGRILVRTDNCIATDGTPPRRFILVAFDSLEQAKAWNASAAMQEINAGRAKATRSRQFLVEGVAK